MCAASQHTDLLGPAYLKRQDLRMANAVRRSFFVYKRRLCYGFFRALLIAVGLSMDAFAVAVCKGMKMRRLDIGKTAVIALFFGGFQALMPLIGWALGKQFERYITSIDHWIAFFLLLFIGGKMIIESFKKDKDSDEKPEYEEARP